MIKNKLFYVCSIIYNIVLICMSFVFILLLGMNATINALSIDCLLVVILTIASIMLGNNVCDNIEEYYRSL